MHDSRNSNRLLGLGLSVLALVGCGDSGAADDTSPTSGVSTEQLDSSSTAVDPDTGDATDPTTDPTTAHTSDTGDTAVVTDGDTTASTAAESSDSGDTLDTTGVTTDTTGLTTDTTGVTTDTTTDTTDTTGDSDTTGSDTGVVCDEESEDRVVKLGKLVDPLDGSVIVGALVHVHEDRVVYVGTDASMVPCGAQVIDWSAYTGVPGLIDAHTHFVYQSDGAPGTKPWERYWALYKNDQGVLVDLMRQAAKKTLKLGVTTVIDKGAGGAVSMVYKLKADIASGEVPGPRIFTAGRGLSNTGTSIEQLKSYITNQVLEGSELVKIFADACSDEDLVCAPKFNLEQLEAAVEHAHSLGKAITIHAYHADTAKLVIQAGPDSMEHPEGLDAIDFMDMNAKGITYIPTIDHNRYYKENLAFFSYDPSKAAEFDAFIAANLATANQAHLAGVKIAFGSDAVFTGFGENTRELQWFIEAGMTPLEALRAATVRSAETIGVDDELGRVAPGYFADIVVVDGDPLADIGVVLDKVTGVMKAGEVIDL